METKPFSMSKQVYIALPSISESPEYSLCRQLIQGKNTLLLRLEESEAHKFYRQLGKTLGYNDD